MIDPARPEPLDLKNFDAYLETCRQMLQRRLAGMASIEEVAKAESELNRYPRLDDLAEPRDIVVINDEFISPRDLERGVDALLAGAVLLEHACAGEATRLGLGTKYLINARRHLTPEILTDHLGPEPELPHPPEALRPLSLGRRHMLQLAWDLWRLAEENGLDPRQVLKRQHLLIIVNEQSAQGVIDDFREAQFYGFERRRVLFMVQRAFHGFNLGPQGWFYDQDSPLRLHNHGQMLMQTTMDGQLFRLDEQGGRRHLAWKEYLSLLNDFVDKVSFNIEDLDYLSQSLDHLGLAAALKLAEAGAGMVMEVVNNDPDNPIKGGACYWDPELNRNVMIESFCLQGVQPEDIAVLNKNINHYPQPARSLSAAREQGLAMPLVVKKNFLYFQPVQGDLNFLVPTAFVRRPRLKPIRAWKGPRHTRAALTAMAFQDQRPGFWAWASGLTGLAL